MLQYEELIDEVLNRLNSLHQEDLSFEVEASGRHIHLSREAIDALFGEGYQLTKVKDLSQPGQFVSKERITIAGPKGQFANVVILGPERPQSQVEVSLTDSRDLGLAVPIRESGHLEQTPGITLINGENVYVMKQGLIVAQRHIHMSPEDAKKNHVENGEVVKVKVDAARALIFDDVVVRVHPNFSTYMHIDYDEANACGFSKGIRATILK